MKVVAINGSPRKNWNTEKLLKRSITWAESIGAETKLIQLYDLKYTGCKSCFTCKRKNNESYHCALKDELSSVLDEILEADALFLGSPIYFSDLTGEMGSFLERLLFPLLSYDYHSKQLFKGKINVAMFYTMNAPKSYYKESMEQNLSMRNNLLKLLGGKVEVYASCDTYQFLDYDKYASSYFDKEHKKKVHEEEFPYDLEEAYKIGVRLTSK